MNKEGNIKVINFITFYKFSVTGKRIVELTREEKIKFCVESAEAFGEPSERSYFESLSDEELDGAVIWLDYLWQK